MDQMLFLISYSLGKWNWIFWGLSSKVVRLRFTLLTIEIKNWIVLEWIRVLRYNSNKKTDKHFDLGFALQKPDFFFIIWLFY